MHASARTATALALTALLLAGLPAGAEVGDCRPLDDVTPDVTLCEREAFAKPIAGRLGNFQGITWADEAPTGDITSASVAANFVPGSVFLSGQDPRFRPTLDGQYTGTLDTIEVNAYITDPVVETIGGNHTIRALLTINDEVIYDNTGDGVAVTITPSEADENISIASFVFTDVHKALMAYGMANDADTEHQIRISWSEQYYGDGNNVVYYDSADTPTNLYFNRLARTPAANIDVF